MCASTRIDWQQRIDEDVPIPFIALWRAAEQRQPDCVFAVGLALLFLNGALLRGWCGGCGWCCAAAALALAAACAVAAVALAGGGVLSRCLGLGAGLIGGSLFAAAAEPVLEAVAGLGLEDVSVQG